MAAFSRTHAFVSAIADGTDATLVRPSNWNAAHSLSGAVSGGIPFFDSTTTENTSALLVANQLMLGGGAATAPATLGSLGTTTTVLHGNAAGAPSFSAVVEADITLADNTTNNVSATAHGFAPKFPNNTTTFLRGDGTYAAPATMTATVGGLVPTPPNNTTTFLRGDGTFAAPTASVTWDTITAAAGSATTANGNNTITYNIAATSNNQASWTFGETSAATGGTYTTISGSLGTPNQILCKVATLAASTASPLAVYSRGNHVFNVSATTTQVLYAAGSTSSPTVSGANASGSGLYFTGNNDCRLAGAGKLALIAAGNLANGQILCGTTSTAAAPALSEGVQQTTGIFWPSVDEVCVTNDGVESVRFGPTVITASRGGANATAMPLNFRKSRGTVLSPTVITTGDALATVSGYGYVGATNTYLQATQIKHLSTGTIADATTGIGGIVTISTTLAGTDTAVQETVRFYGGSQPFQLWAPITQANLGTPANGTITYCSDCTIANPCAGGGTGAIAKRLNGAWVCN